MKIAYYRDARSMTSTLMLEESLRKYLGSTIEIIPLQMEQIGALYNDAIDLFIVPGVVGEVCHYHEHLGGRNAKTISDFVSNGGVYLGLCAGGYYAMTEIEYAGKDNTKKIRQSPFGFIKGKATGPVDGENLLNPYAQLRGYCGVRPIQLVGKFARYDFNAYSLYSSGPTFQPAEKAEILAVFKDNALKPSALIAKNHGKGLAIASSTVPYHLNDSFQAIAAKPSQSCAAAVYTKLSESLVRHQKECSAYWSLILETVKWHRQNVAHNRQHRIAKVS